GDGWGRLQGLGILALCDYIEQNVLAEYRRLESEIGKLRADLALAQERIQQLEAAAFAAQQGGAPAAPPAEPTRRDRPLATAALVLDGAEAAPADRPAQQSPGRPPDTEATELPAAVRRALEQMGEDEKAGLGVIASGGISRLPRLGVEERVRERLVSLGLVEVQPLQLLPGRTGDALVRLTPLGKAVAAALGTDVAASEAERWEAWYGDAVKGYLLAELASAWEEAGYETDLDPERTRLVGEGGLVVTPDAVVRTPDGGRRYVWLFREGKVDAERLRDAAACTADIYAVGMTRDLCRAIQQAFTNLALADKEIPRRAVVLWLATFEQAVARQFKAIPSGPAAAQRVRQRRGAEGAGQGDG
ncbi:MAG TPA: hypothetical protein VIK99_06790, partial [Thermaerobacter sp.]